MSHRIDRTEYGFRFEHIGKPDSEEVVQFCEDARHAIDQTDGTFCVLSDQRELEIFPEELSELMAHAQSAGLTRSAAVVGSLTSQMQIDRLVSQARDGDSSIVVRAEDHADPLDVAREWLESGVDPTG
ncbi:MAG: hypothetical protein ABEI99_09220 [Halobaculum sp.]